MTGQGSLVLTLDHTHAHSKKWIATIWHAALTVLEEAHLVADGKHQVRLTQMLAVPAVWQWDMLADVLPESLRH